MNGSDEPRSPADSLSDTLETVRLTPERAASLVQAALDARGGEAPAFTSAAPAIQFTRDAGFDEDAPTRPGVHPRGSAPPSEPPSYELECGADWLGLPGPLGLLSGLRLALVASDAARADGVAQDLRLRGALVQVFNPRISRPGLSRLRDLDPVALLVDPGDAQHGATELLRAVGSDAWLQGARVVPVALAEQWSESGAPSSDALVERINRELHSLRAALDAAGRREQFGCDLAKTPISALLRGLGEAPPCSVRVSCPERVYTVAFLEGVVAGAVAARQAAGEQPALRQHGVPARRVSEGPLALAQLVQERSGLITISPGRVLDGPPNLICPVDTALSLARAELPEVDWSPAERGAVPLSGALLSASPLSAAAGPELASLPRAAAGTSAAQPLRGDAVALSSIAPVALRSSPSMWARGEGGARGWLLAATLAGASFAALLLLWTQLWPTSQPRAEHVAAPAGEQQSAGAPRVLKPPAEPAAAVVSPGLALLDAARNSDTELRSRRKTGGCDSGPGGDLSGATARSRSGDAERLVASARRALNQGELGEAQRAYCGALGVGPQRPQVMRELAGTLLAQGDADAAQAWAKRALQLAPNTTAEVLLGDAQALAGQFREARKTWAKAWSVQADSTLRQIAAAHLVSAMRARAARDSAKAERFYRRAAVLDPTHAGAAQALAEVLFARGYELEATAWAARVSAMQGASAEQRFAAWSLLSRLGTKTEDRPLAARAEAALTPLRAQLTPAQARKYAATPAASSASSK